MDKEDIEDPRLTAGIMLLGNSGSRSFQLRFSDDEDPVVWIAVAEYFLNDSGRPVAKGGKQTFETAAGMTPVKAVLRLCDQVMDGGLCLHCHKPTGVTDEWRGDMPLGEVICWYRYDPETEKFRRGCAGDN